MTLNEYQEKAVSTAIFPQQHALAYLALGLTGESGEVAEKIKKILRDKNGYLKQEDRIEIAKEMGDALWYLGNLAEFLGVDLSYVAQLNVDKLASRKARSKLGGSGDNR
jgi:NTP pyrophosphatase (non-canonical NTP hydrolase)